MHKCPARRNSSTAANLVRQNPHFWPFSAKAPGLHAGFRYVLLAPHVKGTGYHNCAEWCGLDDRKFLEAQREDLCLVFGCKPDFKRRSVGYVGRSDGWQDLREDFKMDWEFEQATDGNIALTGEIDLSTGLEFTLDVALGHSLQSASTQLLQALATPFS